MYGHTIYFFIHSSVNRHLGCFCFFTIMYNAAVHIHVFCVDIFFNSLGSSRIAGTYGNHLGLFEELEDCFPKWLDHQQCMRVLISSHPSYYLLLLLLDTSHLTECEMICIFLLTNHVEQFFMNFLVIFFWKISIQTLYSFLNLSCLLFYYWVLRVLKNFSIEVSYYLYDIFHSGVVFSLFWQ